MDLRWDTNLDGCDLGGIQVRRVAELVDIPFPAEVIYGEQCSGAIEYLRDVLGPSHIDRENLDLLLSFHCFLVRTNQHIILVDLCIGNNKSRPTRPPWHLRDGPFLAQLSAVGVEPDDVDFVMCTHLHADHVGWNTKREDGAWVPTFPNAEYLFTETEYSYWKAAFDAEPPEPLNYGSFEDSVLPVVVAGQATMVASDHRVDAGIHLEAAPGHTPGNVLVHLEDGGGHAILCGDVMHHPVQLIHPEWSTKFCHDQDQSFITRTRLLENYSDTRTLILPAHFQAPTFGRIVRAGDLYRVAL